MVDFIIDISLFKLLRTFLKSHFSFPLYISTSLLALCSSVEFVFLFKIFSKIYFLIFHIYIYENINKYI